MGLFDAVMIKDNHISQWGSISRAVQEVRTKLGHTVKIEVEADRLDQVQQAMAAGADIVLLDNMDIPTLSKAVELCQGKIITEASGGVNLKTVRRISETGVDFISIGELTHSFQNLDFGLDSGH